MGFVNTTKTQSLEIGLGLNGCLEMTLATRTLTEGSTDECPRSTQT